MHFSKVVPLLAAAAPALVSAADKPSYEYRPGTLGFALGTKKSDGSCKYTADYEADFDAISKASGSKLVRGYSADDCNCAQQILPAAKNKGFKVVLGVWPDVKESFTKDTNALKAYATKYTDQVYAVTVGSETLYRGNFTGEELLEKINEVKKILPNTKVGTADSWNKFADGTADAVIKGGVDLLFVNAFAFWQGQKISNASHTYYDDIMQAFAHIQKLAGGYNKVELWNGETGWPSDGGSDYEEAEASTKLAAEYFKTSICSILKWGINVFAFEAFDEPWKPKSIGDNGFTADETHWGVMGADRSSKYSIKC